MAISILIVDDHAMIRSLLRRHLETQEDFVVLGEAKDGEEGMVQAEALQPDVILMDVAMPRMDGIEATRLIHERLPRIKVLILTLYASGENCQRAVQSGASGYLLKDSVAEEVVAAIRIIAQGGYFFGDGVTNPMENLSEEQLPLP
jgi:DNA-binding NarL/FixJ family response regulator